VNRRAIIRLAIQHRLPTIYSLREYAAQGGRMAYGANMCGFLRGPHSPWRKGERIAGLFGKHREIRLEHDPIVITSSNLVGHVLARRRRRSRQGRTHAAPHHFGFVLPKPEKGLHLGFRYNPKRAIAVGRSEMQN
jgi:hypothetical protein